MTGDILDPSDRDWIAVTLVKGTTYQIDVRGWESGEGTQPYPRLYGMRDPDGDPIAPSRVSGLGWWYDDRWLYTATENGKHFIDVGGTPWDGTLRSAPNVGTYTLSVTEVSDTL